VPAFPGDSSRIQVLPLPGGPLPLAQGGFIAFANAAA
jgi:hypothetical protein